MTRGSSCHSSARVYLLFFRTASMLSAPHTPQAEVVVKLLLMNGSSCGRAVVKSMTL